METSIDGKTQGAHEIRYCSGQAVCPGDQITSVGGKPGVVNEILRPGTAVAKQFNCEKGGVLITEDWDGVTSPRVFAVPGDEDWDDVVLLSRS